MIKFTVIKPMMRPKVSFSGKMRLFIIVAKMSFTYWPIQKYLQLKLIQNQIQISKLMGFKNFMKKMCLKLFK